jgi:hypothetical protein
MTSYDIDSTVDNPQEVLEILNNLDNDLDNVNDRIVRLCEDDLLVQMEVLDKPLKNGTDGEVVSVTIKDK